MRKVMLILSLMVNDFAIFAQSTLETEIRILEEKERIAMLYRDTVALSILWASDFMANTPANRITVSRQELFDLMKEGIFNFTSFDRKIEQIFLKDCMAITMGKETVIPTGNNSRSGYTIKRRYTNIWTMQDGIWKLTARHANEICAQ